MTGTTKGALITLEGIEGSGKSTQARKLAGYLEAKGFDVVLTREPGGSPIGEQIRAILLDPSNRKMVALAELFLYEASRTQHMAETIAPALREGKCVICDRFYDASTAYQGAARGLDVATVERLNLLATGGTRPDLTIVLDLAAEVGLGRLGRSPDRLESESLDFHRRVRQGYLAIAGREPDRVKVVDGAGAIDDIWIRITRVVDAWLASRK